MKAKKCKELLGVFLKIGAFTFGGGYAMIPLIKREVAEGKKWLTEEEIFDIIAIAESTPGPLAINCATFVGGRVAGFAGALAATFGVVLPSFLVILAVSGILLRIEELAVVKSAFLGIRAGVLVLIGSALISLFGQTKKDVFSYGILLPAFLAAFVFHINTIFILIVCAAAGIVRSCLIKGKGGGK